MIIKKLENIISHQTDKFIKFIICRLLPASSSKKIYCIGTDKIIYDPGNTLILKAGNGFGDNIMATAVIKGLYLQNPDLRIIVIARHPEIFAHNPYISGCYGLRDIPVFVRLRMKIREIKLQYRPVEQRNNRTHLIDDFYDCLPVEVHTRCYEPCLFLSEQELSYRSSHLEKLSRPLVAVAPYSKRDTPLTAKIYPADKWKKVVGLLNNAGVNIIQIGARSEGPLLPYALDFRDLGYRNTGVVISHCDAVITHVGGIMHLATALKVICVALYGGIEDPAVSGYKQNRNICVDLACAPCWRRQLCSEPECLEITTPEMIVKETLDVIYSRRKT